MMLTTDTEITIRQGLRNRREYLIALWLESFHGNGDSSDDCGYWALLLEKVNDALIELSWGSAEEGGTR